MKRLSWLTVSALALISSACNCGPKGNQCDAICTAGTHCDSSGRCVADSSSTGGGTSSSGGGAATGGGSAAGGGAATGGGSATGGGGAAMGNCTPACSGNTPVCDPQSNTCVTCNATSGCFGSTPFCDTSVLHGQCVGCRGQADCTGTNEYCDQNTHTCQMYMGTGGGSGGGSGGTGGGYNNVVIFDDAGMTTNCLGYDAGTTQCTNECGRGFECINGQCVLRGSTGPIQVTLRFNQPEDLDLHVEEPVDAGTQCDIFYGAPNAPPDGGYLPFPCGTLPHCAANQICINAMCVNLPTQSCGAYGWLDLDSNPACQIDNVDIENIIYSPGQAVHTGQYTVRVDYYQQCSATGPVPYEVEVRAMGQTRYYCGEFYPGQSDSGGANSGVTITSFDIQ
jgi:hypothetical protein